MEKSPWEEWALQHAMCGDPKDGSLLPSEEEHGVPRVTFQAGARADGTPRRVTEQGPVKDDGQFTDTPRDCEACWGHTGVSTPFLQPFRPEGLGQE